MTRTRGRLAVHWQIIIGLVAGILVGAATNLWWTDETWAGIGVVELGPYLDGQRRAAVLPEGVDSAQALNPEDGSLQGKTVYTLTAEQIARYGLVQRDVNPDAGLVAGTARFVRSLTGFVGDLFLRGLRFIAVPIVLFSLVVGASSLNDIAKLGRIGIKTIVIYLSTTAVAITVGLLLANTVGPGRGFSESDRDTLLASNQAAAADQLQIAAGKPDFWTVLLDIVPSNPFNALAETEMLQVVFAALLIGIALTLVPREKARPVIAFCEGMTEVIIKIVHIVMLMAPYAVFALIVTVVADLGLDVLASLARYSLVVLAGLLIMIFGVYPTLLRLLTDVAYTRFFRAISPAQLLAFSSSSSGATLPVTMECCVERLGVKEEVSSFVLPLGATINMDGTALYQGVAAVFIAQMYGIELSVAQQLTIVLTATLASIGTAAVPSAGIVMIIIVLQSVGLPPEGIAVILGVDRILDMCRTTCNVTGDCMVASVVAAGENALLGEEEVARRLAAQESIGLDEFTKEQEELEQARG